MLHFWCTKQENRILQHTPYNCIRTSKKKVFSMKDPMYTYGKFK